MIEVRQEEKYAIVVMIEDHVSGDSIDQPFAVSDTVEDARQWMTEFMARGWISVLLLFEWITEERAREFMVGPNITYIDVETSNDGREVLMHMHPYKCPKYCVRVMCGPVEYIRNTPETLH